MNIVADEQATQMGEEARHAFSIALVAETRRANDRARPDNAVLADGGAPVDDRAMIDDRAGADRHAVFDYRALADPCTGVDHRAGCDAG